MAAAEGRLHPAVADIRRAVRDCCSDVEPGQRLLVACSGGQDSLALAAATVAESARSGWLVGAVVVDHGIQTGSADVAAAVAGRLRDLGFDDVQVISVSIDDGRVGVEAAARNARFTALDEIAARADAIVLLGHTRDDQAETVLLGLARGSGLRSLAGMASIRGRYRRPFLALPRRTTALACMALELEAWQDPHNADDRFARVRVRRTTLPALEKTIGPGIAEALARTAELARVDADALDELSASAARRCVDADGLLDVGLLAAEPSAIRTRVLRSAAIAAGSPASDLTAAHIAEIDRLLTAWHGQIGIDLPGPVCARRRDGRLVFEHPDLRLAQNVGG